MTFIDTGYLIALARREDSLQGRAAAWSQALRGRRWQTDPRPICCWLSFKRILHGRHFEQAGFRALLRTDAQR